MGNLPLTKRSQAELTLEKEFSQTFLPLCRAGRCHDDDTWIAIVHHLFLQNNGQETNRVHRINRSEIEAKDVSTIVDYFPHSVKRREHRLKGHPRRPRQTTDVSVHNN